MREASDVAGLAAELGIDRGLLYKWDRAFEAGGAEALRLPGERARRPAPGFGADAGLAPAGTVELERKVAQQALELDFCRAALQHFAGPRRKDGRSGGTGSTS
jgi:transposase-like protein